jgi:hypothetical protein
MRPIGMVDTIRAMASAGCPSITGVSVGPGLMTLERMTVLEIQGPGSDEGTEGGLRCAIDAEGSRAFYARYGAVEDNRATILHQR